MSGCSNDSKWWIIDWERALYNGGISLPSVVVMRSNIRWSWFVNCHRPCWKFHICINIHTYIFIYTKGKKLPEIFVIFDIRGFVHYKFAPTVHAVDKEYYLSVLMSLRERISRKRPELWAKNFQADNVPSHRAVVQYHRSTPVFPPGPMRLFLLTKLKLPLRGTRFDTIKAVK